MKVVRNLVLAVLSANLIFSQGVLARAIESKNGEIKIGDKYEKKIVIVNSQDEKDDLFIAPRYFSCINKDAADRTILEIEEVLIPKTSAKYEIALSYEDGDYTYAGTADSYEEAVEKADLENEKLKTVTTEFIVPVVLSTATGNIDYAKYGIGRCFKHYKPGVSSEGYGACSLYSDEELKNEERLIHQNHCSEMPLLEQRDKEAKVYINGYSGWMNRDINRCAGNPKGKCSSDVDIEPITRVKNPSFYYAGNDGFLYHYISTSMVTSEVEIGSYEAEISARKIGKAPSCLEKDVKYLSYDGIHFYTTKDVGITKALYLITENLKAGNFNDSVNVNNPYYNYYLYLPFRSRTNYTAEELNKYIDYYLSVKGVKESKLKGIGEVLIKNQNKYGVNALLTLSIAINESDGGTVDLSKNNILGLNATDYNPTENADDFDTVDDCIEAFCKDYISRWFADGSNSSFCGGFLGNKRYGANAKYASDPYWADKAANVACKIENYLSDRNINNFKDYDYYQLFKYNKAGSVQSQDNKIEYKVNDKFISRSGEFVGSIGILICNNIYNIGGVNCNEIVLDRNLQSDGKNNGTYNWSKKGYINKDSIQLINKGRTNMDKSDVNKDGKIDEVDLAKAASLYNSNDYNLDYMCDINNDGIIDIYDIVSISSRL